MRRPSQNISPATALAAWNAAQPGEDAESAVTVTCRLITPMYGGGVKPGEVDCDLPIRASALRGQLRFWWRLLHGAGKESADLFAAESSLWGGISSNGAKASRVRVQIEGARVSDQQLVRKSDSDTPPYALILDRNEDPALLKQGYSSDLVLHFKKGVTSSQRDGVMEALRWWASFGGVGARTRRGLGTVRVTGDNLAPATSKEVKARGGWMAVGRPATTAVKAWREAVGALQRFRQGPGEGRNRGQGSRPGRSRWPEADAIRRLQNTHAPAHSPEPPVDSLYPRAAFGLPIVFHFKNMGDPGNPDPTLKPAIDSSDRMASPLILRPYFDGEKYRPLALLLPGWEERVSIPVHLDSNQEQRTWPENPHERTKLAKSIQPMGRRGSDALSAFMRYFQETLG